MLCRIPSLEAIVQLRVLELLLSFFGTTASTRLLLGPPTESPRRGLVSSKLVRECENSRSADQALSNSGENPGR